MLRRLGHGFDHNVGSGVGQRGKNAAGMQPPHPQRTEDVAPVNVPLLQLGRRGHSAVRDTHRTADSIPALGEVEAIADSTANAVVRHPPDQRRVNAPLHDEIFDQTR